MGTGSIDRPYHCSLIPINVISVSLIIAICVDNLCRLHYQGEISDSCMGECFAIEWHNRAKCWATEPILTQMTCVCSFMAKIVA